ncbi:MAG: DEAD/DEAH box helicase [bacterium]|nr:DEAD/DEAH box helicase [bacterium]
MSFCQSPAEARELIRLWKAQLLVEEALGQSLLPVRPEVARLEGRNYFKLGLGEEARNFLLRQDTELKVPLGGEELPFLAYLLKEDRIRKRYRLPTDHEIWVGFPSLYFKDRYGKAQLASLFRFPLAETKYPDLNIELGPEASLPPGEHSLKLVQEELASQESPYFLDELFLTERLGLLDEEIIALRRKGHAEDSGPEQLFLALLEALDGQTAETLDWDQALGRLGTALAQRAHLGGPTRLFPYALVYELDQGQPTRNLQRDLDDILELDLLDELEDLSPAAAYLYGHHQEEAKEVRPLAQVDRHELTPSQAQALSLALGRRFSVIGGPPGTGKTQVIKNLLAHRLVKFAASLEDPSHRALGLSAVTLVASTNNRAVDNALEGLDEPDLLPVNLRLGSRLLLVQRTLGFLSEYHRRLAEADPGQGLRDFNRYRDQLAAALKSAAEPEAAPSRHLYLLGRKLIDAYARANQTEALKILEVLIEDIEGKRGLKALKRKETADLIFALFPLIGSTLLSLRNTFELDTETLGLLVIDEAGQCAPHYVLPALLLARHAVLLGDPRQLEPIARMRAEELESLRKSRKIKLEPEQARFACLFVEQPRSAQSVAQEAVEEVFPLREHFRCRPEIIEVCTDLCGYDLHLKRESGLSLTGPALQYLEVLGPEQRYGGSWWNPLEVDHLLVLLERFRGMGFEWGQMAVLTPFRGQLVFINQALSRSRIPHQSGEGGGERADAVATGTVHRFQGGERPLVFFSQVISDGDPVFLNSRVNLLNVALSRAQEHFCYLGSLDSLARGPFTSILAQHLRAKGKRLN